MTRPDDVRRAVETRKGHPCVAAGLTASLLCWLFALATPAQAAVRTSHSGWRWGSPQPQGQTIRSLAFRAGRGYAAGQLGTLLRTEDGGRNWAGVATGTTAELNQLALPDSDSVVAAGNCEVLRSDDYGATFRRLPWSATGVACPAPAAAVQFPSDQVGYLVLANGSTLASSDGGASWTVATAVPQTVLPNESLDAPADAAFPGTRTGVVVTTGGRIYRTDDAAASWKLVHTGASALRGIEFASDVVGYAVGDGGTVLRTLDGGSTWTARPPAFTDLASVTCSGLLTCLVTAADGAALLRTVDGGASFAVSTPARRAFAAAFDSALEVVSAGEAGATALSDDAGLTWTPVGRELGQSLSRVRVFKGGMAIAAGRSGALALSDDHGETWANRAIPTTDDVIDFSFLSERRGFALDAGGALFKTEDGVDWARLGTGPAVYPQALVALERGTLLLIGPRGIARSADGGESFRRVRNRIVRRSKLFGVDQGGLALFAYGSKNMLASTDRGRRWDKVPIPRKALLAGVDFITSRTGYALGQNGRVWVTRDRGRNWHDLSGIGTDDAVGMGFSDRAHGYLALSHYGDDTRGYLLRTSDGGRTWRPQLLTAAPVAPDGIAAGPEGIDFALTGTTSLLFTQQGGDRGRRSVVSLAAPARLRRGSRLRMSGRISGAAAGSEVLISRRQRGESVWDNRTAVVGRDGRFRTVWRLGETATFVAQWAGDENQAGDGSRPLAVRAVHSRH